MTSIQCAIHNKDKKQCNNLNKVNLLPVFIFTLYLKSEDLIPPKRM